MIDNISLQFNDKKVVEDWYLANKEKFPITQKRSLETKESQIITYPIVSKRENLELRITEKQAILQGSIHKYYNYLKYRDFTARDTENREYDYLIDSNYNDFYLLENIIALEELKDFFDGLDLSETKITSLEFGFNLEVEKNPTTYLDFNFLLYEYKPPFKNYDTYNMRFTKFLHNKFMFKVYDKKRQKQLYKNILRVEIVLKQIHLKEIGILNFNDLLNENNFEKLYQLFQEKFNNFILIDNRHEEKSLVSKMRIIIGDYLEPSYWRHRKGKPNLNRYKKRFQEIVKNEDLLKTKQYFQNLLHSKFEELFFGVVYL